jgi:hypothetical protein
MRFPAAVVPGILVLAGAFYFFAKDKDTPGRWPTQHDQAATAPAQDLLADDADRELVRSLLETRDLTEDQADSLVRAAGRRYMRRKLAYVAAKQAVDAGKAAPGALDSLRQDMESARKVCDLAESLGPRAREMNSIAQADWEMERRLAYIPSTMVGLAERFDGVSAFTDADLDAMEQAFLKHFGKPMPVSTRGDSAVHRAMGFDHRGRFDVAVSPSQPEGVWARRYLTEKHVTFFAFRSAVPGRATGAHIHIGPASAHRAPKS